jgi:hypothetical protein
MFFSKQGGAWKGTKACEQPCIPTEPSIECPDLEFSSKPYESQVAEQDN